MSEQTKIYFVLPSNCSDETSASTLMRQAFELCCQNQLMPEWISEENSSNLNYHKTDIVVFEEFKGEAFKTIQTTKCFSIAGPWCIITCLLDGLQVPNNRSPVFNMAMNKLTITASNYSVEEKKRMKEKIEMMGGKFSLHITNNVTHLITNSVRTQKYTVANEKNLMVMLDSWIDDVWNKSLTHNIKATDSEFLKHKCPIFKNLQLTCTGFDATKRKDIIQLINKNGGQYSGKLNTNTTDAVICNLGVYSDKFNVAKKAKIPCLRDDWIYDSIERGYALPEHEYIINITISTPTKTNAPLNEDFSMMSAISNFDNNDVFKSSVSDTMNLSVYNLDSNEMKSNSKKCSSIYEQKENKVPNVIDSIDLNEVKEAGTFLDGCGVYLIGFSNENREKLCRILKSAGATRYDDISERVTQIITGNNHLDTNELKSIKANESILPIVSIEWLVECIKQRQPVYEEPFIIKTNTSIKNTLPSSPLSKKGLTLLQHDDASVPVVPEATVSRSEQDASFQLYVEKNKTNQEDEDTLAQLLMQGNAFSKISVNEAKSKTDKYNNTDDTEQEETACFIFQGKTFKLIGQSDEDIEILKNNITEFEGEIMPVSYKGITDYAVVPPISNPLRHTATEVVNNLWVMECHNLQELIPVAYYHQPIYNSTPIKPLHDCVITISGYINFERSFLIHIIQHLGAIYQDKFARVTLPDHSVKASTHLICFATTGSKYLAALRWNRPVVNHKWLLSCAEQGIKCDEKLFTLTETTRNEETQAPTLSTSTSSTIQRTNKRDFEGRNISVLPNEYEKNNDDNISKQETNILRKKMKNDVNEFESSFQVFMNENDDDNNESSFLCSGNNKKDEEYQKLNSSEIIVEGGRKVGLSKYMQELRDQGLFDTPSPPPKLNSGTPVLDVLERLRKEGKIPPKKNETTPNRINTDKELVSGSQGTPVGRFLRSLKERKMLPASPQKTACGTQAGSTNNCSNVLSPDSPAVRPFYDVKTPDTPLGRFLGEDEPSRETRKHWQRYLDKIPVYNCHDRPTSSKERRPSTPYTEVKKQVWNTLLRQEETESQHQLNNQIDQIQNILLRNTDGPNRNSLLRLDGSTPHKQTTTNFEQNGFKITTLNDEKHSQADTVGWDEPIELNMFEGQEAASKELPVRKFMLSVLEPSVRNKCIEIITSLGGEISDLSHYDDSATHVVCANPTRNEKILSSIAAGKWIVHYNYIQHSEQEGHFLDEDMFEFGNPKATNSELVKETPIIQAIHWWRLKILETKNRAFHGMRALIFTKNNAAIIRLIEAGGGFIVQAQPPFAHSLNVTHCFLDAKNNMNINDFIPLAEQGIYCLNVSYLSNFLYNKSNVDKNEFIMPPLRVYYK